MNFNKLKFGDTIGIIGGGQLGKMMAQSAQKMGFKVICLDPNPDSPCKSVAHEFITAAMTMKKLCMNSVRNLMLSLMSLKIFQLNNLFV